MNFDIMSQETYTVVTVITAFLVIMGLPQRIFKEKPFSILTLVFVVITLVLTIAKSNSGC